MWSRDGDMLYWAVKHELPVSGPYSTGSCDHVLVGLGPGVTGLWTRSNLAIDHDLQGYRIYSASASSGTCALWYAALDISYPSLDYELLGTGPKSTGEWHHDLLRSVTWITGFCAISYWVVGSWVTGPWTIRYRDCIIFYQAWGTRLWRMCYLTLVYESPCHITWVTVPYNMSYRTM